MPPAFVRAATGASNSTTLTVSSIPAGLVVGAAESAGHRLILASCQRGSGSIVSAVWRPNPAIVDGSIDEPFAFIARPAFVNTDVDLWELVAPSPSVPAGGQVRTTRDSTSRAVLWAGLVAAPSGRRPHAAGMWLATGVDPELAYPGLAAGDLVVGAIGESNDDIAPRGAGAADLGFQGAGGGTASPVGINVASWPGALGAMRWTAGNSTWALAGVALIGAELANAGPAVHRFDICRRTVRFRAR